MSVSVAQTLARQRRTHLLRVDSEGTLGGAPRTETDSNLGTRVLVEWTEDVSTLATIELDILELRVDAAPPRDDSRDPDEGVEVDLSEVAQGVGRRELRNADVHLGMDTSVGGVEEEDDVEGYLVEEGEHRRGRVGEEVREDGLAVGEVEEGHFERLGVDCGAMR